MAVVIYRPNPVGYTQVTRSPSGLVGRHLKSLGRKVEMLAKRDVGVKTGRLRSSINSSLTLGPTGLAVTIGSSNRIALMHHEGTRRHVIVPKYAKFLVFRANGKLVMAKKVNHPGTRANPYLTRNLRVVVLSS